MGLCEIKKQEIKDWSKVWPWPRASQKCSCCWSSNSIEAIYPSSSSSFSITPTFTLYSESTTLIIIVSTPGIVLHSNPFEYQNCHWHIILFDTHNNLHIMQISYSAAWKVSSVGKSVRKSTCVNFLMDSAASKSNFLLASNFQQWQQKASASNFLLAVSSKVSYLYFLLASNSVSRSTFECDSQQKLLISTFLVSAAFECNFLVWAVPGCNFLVAFDWMQLLSQESHFNFVGVSSIVM